MTSKNSQVTTTASPLFDHVLKEFHIKNDAALSRLLDVKPPVLSKMRHSQLSVGTTIMVNTHELTGMTMKAIRLLANAPSGIKPLA